MLANGLGYGLWRFAVAESDAEQNPVGFWPAAGVPA